MMRWVLCGVLAMCAGVWGGSALAVDASGKFASKGVGRSSCKEFVQVVDNKDGKALIYAGWIDGYISASNLYVRETYDLLPWQGSAVIFSSLGKFCRENPELDFQRAVIVMVRTLHEQRVVEQSAVVEIPVGDKMFRLYSDTLRRTQERLAELGHYTVPPSGTYDRDTKWALEAYQRAKSLPITGLPDQPTLTALFYRQSG